MFQPTEPPNDIALPIDLDQIRLILETMIGVAMPCAAKDLAVRQQLVGKALQTFPQLHFLTIHIDQQGAKIRCRKNGVPIPRLGGIVQSDAGRIDRWMAHLLSYSSNDQMQHLARRMVTASVEVLRPPGHKDSSDPQPPLLPGGAARPAIAPCGGG